MTSAYELLSVLRNAVAAAISEERAVAVSYSGGLDSSVMASLSSEVSEVKAYSCVTEGSFDERNIDHCAQDDHLSLTVLKIQPEGLRECVARAASVLMTVDPIPIAYTIPVLCVVEGCRERVVVLGTGADELFGGYAKYASMTDPGSAMAADLAKMRLEFARIASYAREKDKRLASPFTSDAVVAFASALPLDRKLTKDGRKIILREVAQLLNLSSSSRSKKAAQYSSGILKEMERQAKEERLRLGEWVSKIVAWRQ